MTSPSPSPLTRTHLRAVPTLRAVEGEGPGPAPHSLLTEQSLIGTTILEPALWPRVAQLPPEDFYSHAHGHIWRALGTLAAAGTPFHPVDIARELQRVGRLADVGGTTHLLGFVDAAIETADPEGCAREIAQLARLRQLDATARSLRGAERKDLPALVASMEQQAREVAEAGAAHVLPGASLADASTGRIGQLQAGEAGDPLAAGGRTSTGFPTLDLATAGFGDGELIILGGRPGLGKTSLALNLATNMAFNTDAGVAIFSYEMTRHELAERVLSSESGIPLESMLRGELTADEWQQLDTLAASFKRLPIWLDDDRSLTIEGIATRAQLVARRLRAKGRTLRLIVVDYLQLVRVGHVKGRSRQEEVAEVSRQLKCLAGTLHCAVLALSQLNRAGEQEQRAPRSSDLRDSGQIEQDADKIGILWRPVDAPPGTTDLRLTKQRKGKACTVRLGWEGSCTRFSDIGSEAAE